MRKGNEILVPKGVRWKAEWVAANEVDVNNGAEYC